ncbi:fibronectin type III domain-containing protein [Paenibacillus durus]|uniref:Fibronectin type-III domain-containing protein n=1 Tax=Paenibacillus durus TaxID=44251 RepID=A0A089HLA6_PAEDU|nr:fibronectin type III domain-containing protein [Paenibacillus durus]AIQ11173.1 hypothetical protein PDUR_03545 [Paenibacillus durus]
MLIFNKNKVKRKVATLMLAAIGTVTIFSQTSFALNAQSNANFLFRGVQVLDDDEVVVYLDKGTSSITKDMFKIYEGIGTGGTPISITGISSYSTPYNLSVSGYAPGSSYILTAASGTFDEKEAYTIEASSTVRAGNGLTLGDALQRKNPVISFVRPDSSSDYGTGNVNMWTFMDSQNNGNIARDGGLYISLSKPASNASAVLSGLKLYKNTGSGYTEVTYDNPSSPTTTTDVFQPVKSNQDDFFYIPLSIAGNGTGAQKNLLSNTAYRLDIPEIPLQGGGEITNSLDPNGITSIYFTTMNGIGPTKMNSAPTASVTGSSVDLSWTATSDLGTSPNIVGAAATGYNVYHSTDKYFGFTKVNSSAITGTSYSAGSYASGTHYFRITPIANSYEGGYSNDVVVTIP